MIDTSRIQHGEGLKVITTQSAAPKLSQSASHVIDALFLLSSHVL